MAFLSNRDSVREDSGDGYLCTTFSGDIYVMNADGSGVIRLTDESSCYGMGLDWSPAP
jgi:hypothetical protein